MKASLSKDSPHQGSLEEKEEEIQQEPETKKVQDEEAETKSK